MAGKFLPATADIKQVFVEELTSLGGTIADTYDDGSRLFLRGVLPKLLEVRSRDKIQGGVALRASERDIAVHPYTFREVCRNGAIMAEAIETRCLERVDFIASSETVAGVIAELRDVIQACSDYEVFAGATQQMRSAADIQADIALQLMPMLSRLPEHMVADVAESILGRFESSKDRSAFGLMNAVTSVARDTRDPKIRWRLEELGGGIPARLRPAPQSDDAAAQPLLA
jgi:hypothetical protein